MSDIDQIMNMQRISLSVFYEGGGFIQPTEVSSDRCLVAGTHPPGDDLLARLKVMDKDIVDFMELTGRNISPAQFFIKFGDSGWTISRLGTTPVWLDDVELEPVLDHVLEHDVIIRVPNATISLKFQNAIDNDIQIDGDNLAWRLVQDQLNKDVADEYRIQVGSGLNERKMSNEEIRDDGRFVSILSTLARDAVAQLNEQQCISAVYWAVRKYMTAKVAGASRRSSAIASIPPQFISQQLGLLGERTTTDLGLCLQRELVHDDLDIIEKKLLNHVKKLTDTIPPGDRTEITKAFLCANIWDFIFNFGPITDLLKLDVVSEVMVVSHDRIYYERAGVIHPYGYTFSSRLQLEVLIRRIAEEAGRSISESNAMVDFRLNDGSRVNVISTPLSLNGPCVTIRKHKGEVVFTLDRLVEYESMSQSMAWFLQSCVRARKNIVISGGTGSGKTTLLNALSNYIPDNQRVVTIEDTAELALSNEHVISLQSRPANAEGENEVDIRQLVKNALRMRPDRIIVGECRGGEAVDMLQALNTGHEGSMTTAHANATKEMLLRLEVMVLQGEPNLPVSAIRQQIAKAIQIVVQVNRREGKRRVTEISEVVDIDENTGEIVVESIFRLINDVGETGKARHIFTGMVPAFVQEIFVHRPSAPDMEQGTEKVALEDIFI